jgi:hypothetical protein
VYLEILILESWKQGLFIEKQQKKWQNGTMD